MMHSTHLVVQMRFIAMAPISLRLNVGIFLKSKCDTTPQNTPFMFQMSLKMVSMSKYNTHNRQISILWYMCGVNYGEH